MDTEQLRTLARKIIHKDKWWDILSRFIDVLRINIFVVDLNGRILLPPEESKYGGRLLTDSSLGFDLLSGAEAHNIMEQFIPQGPYLESINRYNLHSFAIPIKVENNQIIAYMVIGPIMLNLRLNTKEYQNLAAQFGVSEKELMDSINELRVVSNVMMSSILDLLSEIIKDNIELSLKKEEFDFLKNKNGLLETGIRQTANEIYATACLDELLVTFLDVALKMTETECGSIMVFDQEKGELFVKVYRGLDSQVIQNVPVNMTTSVSGAAFKEKEHFYITSERVDNRIKPFLQRPEIKQSLIMPLIFSNRVLGVLNLHTKKNRSKLEDNINNLQYLSQLVSQML